MEEQLHFNSILTQRDSFQANKSLIINNYIPHFIFGVIFITRRKASLSRANNSLQDAKYKPCTKLNCWRTPFFPFFI